MNESNSQNPSQNNFLSRYGIFSSPRSIVIVYTVFKILVEMRKFLGLEAMLEYIGKHIENLEKINPEMKSAVDKALFLINVKKIYEEAMSVKE